MDLSTVVIVVFLAVITGTVTLILLVRDLVFSSGSREFGVRRTQPMRRMPTVFDKPRAHTIRGRLDQAFDYLVYESDIGATPLSASLLLLATALAIGGGVWLYTDNVFYGSIGGIVGLVLPMLYMLVQRIRRFRAVEQQLPYVLEMMARSVRAGQSLDQAITLVARDSNGVLSREFARCQRQLEMGRSFEKTLKSLAARIRLVDMRILATTLIVQRKSGGKLPETLERMATVVRDRLNAKRQMQATSAAGRASTMLIATIVPGAYVFMMTFMPKHMRAFTDDALGKQLLALAIALLVIGIVWVLKLVRSQ